jgi:DNA recombination protein RmuC
MTIWIVVLSGLAALLSLVGLIVLLGHGRRLAAMESALPDLQNSVKPVSDAVLHAKDAKDAVLRIAAEVSELQGRQGAIAEGYDNLKLFLVENADRQRREINERLTTGFNTNTDAVVKLRTETLAALVSAKETMTQDMTALRASNETKLAEIITRTTESAETLNRTALQTQSTVSLRVAELKESVDAALKSELGAIRTENSEKLEAMRQTVDEKLHATLEQRLGDSFKLVSDRLEQVHRGLGEMQSLATGVGDLRKVLTNVKMRGTFGEVQLDNLLDQVLTAEQYDKNVAVRPGSGARVEFALRLPGKSDDGVVYLPIDAKFPVEDYQRLLDAQDRADVVAVEEAGKALEARIRLEGKSIRDKYIEPPYTTDFAVMYLCTEGLYAEVLRRPGLAEWLQRECKITLSGPTTLAAFLNSLQMGFRTLAIEKRSSEVWQVLGAVKTEFGKFGEALAHTKKKLEEATNSIDKAQTRNNVLTRRLKSVDQLPEPEAVELLGLTADPSIEADGDVL